MFTPIHKVRDGEGADCTWCTPAAGECQAHDAGIDSRRTSARCRGDGAALAGPEARAPRPRAVLGKLQAGDVPAEAEPCACFKIGWRAKPVGAEPAGDVPVDISLCLGSDDLVARLAAAGAV